MNNLSDTLTIGLVLLLLVGSIALYLYTRIQQSEQKINLLESILLDLKMSNELKGYTELPADDREESGYEVRVASAAPVVTPATPVAQAESYVPYEDAPEAELSVPIQEEAASYPSLDDALLPESALPESAPSEDLEEAKPNYESMSLKELQALVKSRGITGVPVKKSAYVDALKAADEALLQVSLSNLPGSLGAGANSFIETSASFSNDA